MSKMCWSKHFISYIFTMLFVIYVVGCESNWSDEKHGIRVVVSDIGDAYHVEIYDGMKLVYSSDFSNKYEMNTVSIVSDNEVIIIVGDNNKLVIKKQNQTWYAVVRTHRFPDVYIDDLSKTFPLLILSGGNGVYSIEYVDNGEYSGMFDVVEKDGRYTYYEKVDGMIVSVNGDYDILSYTLKE